MKRSYLLALVCLAVVFASCATQVPVQITKPAEINMAGARQLAVLDFDYARDTSNQSLYALLLLSLNGQLSENTNTIEYKMARHVTDQLMLALINTNYFTVVSSKDVVSKMKASGSNDLSATEIGRQSNAQAIIVGRIISINRDVNSDYEKEQIKDKATGVISTNMVLYTSAVDSVSMSYQVVSTSTGQIIATKSFSDKLNQRVKGDSRTLVGQEDQCKKIIDNWIPQITKQIAPYQVTEYRVLISDKTKDPNMKAADEFVKNKAYEKALEIYLNTWTTKKNPAAGTDAAIMYDILGKLDQALAMIDVVVKETGDKDAVKEQARLKQLKIENDRLAEQMKKS